MKNPEQAEWAAEVRRLMKQNGIGRNQLAAAMRVANSSVSRWFTEDGAFPRKSYEIAIETIKKLTEKGTASTGANIDLSMLMTRIESLRPDQRREVMVMMAGSLAPEKLIGVYERVFAMEMAPNCTGSHATHATTAS